MSNLGIEILFWTILLIYLGVRLIQTKKGYKQQYLKWMRVKLEPETAFIGKKFAYIFLGLILTLNAITFIWFFLFSNLK